MENSAPHAPAVIDAAALKMFSFFAPLIQKYPPEKIKAAVETILKAEGKDPLFEAERNAMAQRLAAFALKYPGSKIEAAKAAFPEFCAVKTNEEIKNFAYELRRRQAYADYLPTLPNELLAHLREYMGDHFRDVFEEETDAEGTVIKKRASVRDRNKALEVMGKLRVDLVKTQAIEIFLDGRKFIVEMHADNWDTDEAGYLMHRATRDRMLAQFKNRVCNKTGTQLCAYYQSGKDYAEILDQDNPADDGAAPPPSDSDRCEPDD